MNDLRSTFFDQGYAFPVDVMSRQEAARCRNRFESLEQRLDDMRYGFREQLSYPHILFRFADEIVRTPAILDAVGSILGGDIMVWSTTLLIKEPHTHRHVSWHQDLRYWGLSDETSVVSTWLALSEVTTDNGCMRFIPGSHKHGLYEHDDTRAEDNSLSRGQQARVAIDESAVLPVPLSPGQMSMHHGWLLHSSAPNHTDDRRIGFITVYIAPSVRQTSSDEDYAMLVRGKDTHGHFTQVPPPREDLSDTAKSWHQRVLAAQDKIIGADKVIGANAGEAQ